MPGQPEIKYSNVGFVDINQVTETKTPERLTKINPTKSLKITS